MLDSSDFMYLAVLLLVVLVVLLIPPGPGTPLRMPVPTR